MFKFKEGAQVALKTDSLLLGLSAGVCGTVWALYDTQLLAYEVTFRTQDGEEFDALMYEDKLTEPPLMANALDRQRKRSLASA